MITIKNKKVVTLLKEKEELVLTGRETSKKIEALDLKIFNLDKKERKITDSVLPKELLEKGEALKAKINLEVEELQKIGQEIENAKIEAIPQSMVDEHYAYRDEKEKLEKERNKIALKIQKIKDKVIPLIKKEVAPQIGEYEDIESSEIINDEVVIKTFDRLEEFKKSFKKRG